MVESIISSPGAAVLQDPQPPGYPESGEAVTAPLGRILVDAGVISEEQLSQAKDVARREKTPVAQVLVRDGLVLSRELATLTALHLGLAMVDLRSQSIEPEAVAQLPERISRKCAVLALRGCKGTLTVAMTDPTDLGLLQDLSALAGRFIDPVIATIEDILEHIDIAYRLTETLALASQEGRKPAGRVTAGALQEASPARIIDLLLAQALQDRASDVHIEPAESRLRIRFRMDGILHDAVRLPQELRPALISRIKIVSGMNIAERRRPQDGQFTVNLHDRNVDVRVAVSNTVEGEMAILRLLDKGFTLRGLGQLGMSSDDLERYRALLRAPYGMLVVCGPTDAGKSTNPLCLGAPDEPYREKGHIPGGPRRVPHKRREPDAGPRRRRDHLRHPAQKRLASGPRRDPGRRGQGPGDGHHSHAGGTDGPSGAHLPARQRCRFGPCAPAGPGGGPIPDHVGAGRSGRPAHG